MTGVQEAAPVIRMLPPSVAARIAAGEVIDRPAAAVKELIENAIDAGATDIQIEARGGGLRLIRVADNGMGIPADEIEVAVRRHATSKLRTLDDLDRLESFGFRGEALASIAAIAELTLSSAVEGETGVRCTFQAGRLSERTPAGRARGTTVTVRDLFSQMPARLKFMRGARAEALQIGATVRRFALARPGLRLTLVLEGHRAFQSNGTGLQEALLAVYGEEVAAALLALPPSNAGDARISGALTNPSIVRATRSQLNLYVNGRYVRSTPLLNAVEAGYRAALPRGRHPAGIIFLEVPPDGVDINVHPAKLDVRLAQEGEIVRTLTEVTAVLYGRQPRALRAPAGPALAGRQQEMPGLRRRIAEECVTFGGWGDGVELPAGPALPPLRLLGQAGNAVLVAEAAGALYLIDQHRAHERIIFEQLTAEGGVTSQALIEPELLTLNGAAAERLGARLDELEALGFACEPFGGSTFLLRATPTGVRLELGADSLGEVLAEAATEQEAWRERFLAMLACRSAIRKGRPLGAAEACDLLTKLAGTRAPALCPHGSPILLQVGDSFLARQFNWG